MPWKMDSLPVTVVFGFQTLTKLPARLAYCTVCQQQSEPSMVGPG